eukprot:PhF_6_TR29417/c0_g1_i5/m.43498
MNNVPNDVWHHTVQYCDFPVVIALRSVSQQLHNLINNDCDTFWVTQFEKKNWPIPPTDPSSSTYSMATLYCVERRRRSAKLKYYSDGKIQRQHGNNKPNAFLSGMSNAMKWVGDTAMSIIRRKMKTIVVAGLDAAGKRTFGHKIDRAAGMVCPHYLGPPELFAMRKNNYVMEFQVFDLDGQEKVRAFRKLYYKDPTSAVIFMIDVSDKDMFNYVVDEFPKFFAESPLLATCPVLIVCNKNEKVNVMGVQEVVEKLNASEVLKGRDWCAMGTSVIHDGPYDVLDTLDELLK